MSRRTCSGAGKVRYRDKKQALRAMRRVQARFAGEKVPVRAYACDRCGGFHLTSKEMWR